MKLLANENFPKASVLALKTLNYDVLSIGEENPTIEDKEVISNAIKEERLIITFDRDYGELVFKKGLRPPSGIIYLRLDSFSPEEPAELIHKLLTSEKFEFAGYLTVADNNFVRQRKY